MAAQTWQTDADDVRVLRELARRYMDIAASPIMAERRALWYAHNDLQECRPLILVESLTEGLRREIFAGQPLHCQEPWAREVEDWLRGWIYHYADVGDDDVATPYYPIKWFTDMGSWGVVVKIERGVDASGGTLGFHWDAPIKDIVRDFDQLKERSFSVDRDKTLAWKAHLEQVFAGILPVQIRLPLWWTMGMTWRVIDLIGLEKLMLDMYDEPEALHRLMSYMRDDHLRLAAFCEKEGLLALNNEGDYTGSGSRGFTHHLPQPGHSAAGAVCAKDMWVLLESQETVAVSPRMFNEFVLPYQQQIAEKFGLVYYGCCEPVDARWQYLKTIPNLRSVSVSPWANVQVMADALQRNYVFSRKPSPALLSTDRFDEDAIRGDIRHTLTAARNCNVELVLKDLHVTQQQPWRMARWVQICREEIARAGW